jgi:hypothetical protein
LTLVAVVPDHPPGSSLVNRASCLFRSLGSCVTLLVLASQAGAGEPATWLEVRRADELPAELRIDRGADSGHLLSGERIFHVEWSAREPPALRGYRLTATMDRGPLAGLAAQWTVLPGAGRWLPGGLRQYRLDLPIAAPPHARLRATLEVLGVGGPSRLLAVRDIRRVGSGGGAFASTPQLSASAERTALAELPHPSAAAATGAATTGPPPVRLRPLARSARATLPIGPDQPRGPPLSCPGLL